MATVKTFDLSKCIFTVGSLTLSGFGETDAVELEQMEDLAETKPSADGATFTVVRSGVKGLNGTITLMTTSLAYKQLAELMEEQADETSIVALPFFLLDPANGDQAFGQYCVFTKRPGMSKKKSVSEAVFGISLPNGKLEYGAYLTT
jgi:hypothetical protein